MSFIAHLRSSNCILARGPIHRGRITPVDTDSTLATADGIADHRDADSDNDGTLDIAERGDGAPISLTSATDTDGDGLLDIFEGSNVSDGFDVNDENRDATTINLAGDSQLAADGSNAIPLTRDSNFRDADTDNDGVVDAIDVDDDNDGILDTVEGVETLTDIPTTAPTPTGAAVTLGDTTITYTDTSGNIVEYTSNGGDDIPFGATSNTIDGFDLWNVPGSVLQIDLNPATNHGVAFTVGDLDGLESVDLRVFDLNGTLIEDITPYLVYADSTNITVTNGGAGQSANVTTSYGSGSTATFDSYAHADFYITIPVSRIEVEQLSSNGPSKAEFYLTAIDAMDDADSDGVADHLDIDSDNDGITDNVEAQTTAGYIAPSGQGAGITDANNDGLDDNYDPGALGAAGGIGLTPVDTDTDGTADYLDTDSDNDGTLDIAERGDGAPSSLTSTTDTDGDGLVDIFEGSNVSDGFDVNDENIAGDNGGTDGDYTRFTLSDVDNETNANEAVVGRTSNDATALTNDLDYRDRNNPPHIDLNSTVQEVFTTEAALVSATGTSVIESFETASGSFDGFDNGDFSVAVTGALSTGYAGSAFSATAPDGAQMATINSPDLGTVQVDLNFAQPTDAVGFNLVDMYDPANTSENVRYNIYLDSELVFSAQPSNSFNATTVTNELTGEVFATGDGTSTFFGFTRDTAFSQVRIEMVDNDPDLPPPNGTDNFGIDRIIYNVAGNPIDYATTFVEDGPAINVVDTDADVFDADNNITGLDIQFNVHPDGASELVQIGATTFTIGTASQPTVTVGGTTFLVDYDGAENFSVTNNAGGVVLQADLDQLIRSITYENTSDDPTTTDRTFDFTLTDATGDTSATATSTISIAAVNDAPVLDLDDNNSSGATGSDYQTVYTEGGPAAAIADADTLIQDVDDTNMESAVVTLTNPQANDRLLIDGNPVLDGATGTTVSGLNFVVSNGGNTITLTGSATKSVYADTIEAISFENTSSTPDTTDRAIEVTVNDGDVNSNTATTIVRVVPVLEATINDITVSEDAGTATFTVTLDQAPAAAPVTIDFATASGSATSGADFTANTGTLTIPVGATSATITVDITDDATYEGAETFTVGLANAAGASIADNQGVATILDDASGPGVDDDRPTLSLNTITVSEGTDPYAVFTLSLSNPSVEDVDVNLALASGTATAGTDFGPALEVSTDGGTTWTPATAATIAAGETSVLVRTPVTDDVYAEGNETFTLVATQTAGTLSNASATGTGTIQDEAAGTGDSAEIAIAGPAAVTEGDTTGAYTLTLTETPATDVTVTLSYSGTATDGSDYNGVTTVTIPAGSTSATFTIDTLEDAIVEGDETLIIDIASITGGGFEEPITEDPTASQISTTISDDDIPAATINDITVSESVRNSDIDINIDTDLSVEGIVVDTVREFGGLGYTSSQLSADLIILDTVNGVNDLGGLGALTADHQLAIGTTIRDTERLNELNEEAAKAFPGQYSNFNANPLVGYSVRMDVGDRDLVGDADRNQIVVETLMRDRVIFVQISNTLGDLPENDRITKLTVLQADGKPLPQWFQQASRDLLLTDVQTNGGEIKLKTIAEHNDGRITTRAVVLQLETAELQEIKTLDTKQPPTFEQQLQHGNQDNSVSTEPALGAEPEAANNG